jgi:hypothetical protein
MVHSAESAMTPNPILPVSCFRRLKTSSSCLRVAPVPSTLTETSFFPIVGRIGEQLSCRNTSFLHAFARFSGNSSKIIFEFLKKDVPDVFLCGNTKKNWQYSNAASRLLAHCGCPLRVVGSVGGDFGSSLPPRNPFEAMPERKAAHASHSSCLCCPLS